MYQTRRFAVSSCQSRSRIRSLSKRTKVKNKGLACEVLLLREFHPRGIVEIRIRKGHAYTGQRTLVDSIRRRHPSSKSKRKANLKRLHENND